MSLSRKRRSLRSGQSGFTLTELAVVLLIVGLLVGSVIGSYSNMINISKFKDAQNLLNTINDALLGFASANGRLPCPATDGVTYGGSNSMGVESPVGGGPCSVATPGASNVAKPGIGYLPAATLGLTPVDSQGFLLDPWNNRILYAVTDQNSGAFTNATVSPNLRAMLIDSLASTPTSTNLGICTTSTSLTTGANSVAACSGASTTLTNNAVAVIISTGPNGTTGGGGTGLDEAKNLDGDRVFVSHTPVPSGTGNEFDDMVMWLSPALLYNRIMSGGI